MNDGLKFLLSLSLSGSLMILVLFICKHFWKDRISRQWQYYIWLIVLARFLCPFAPETNLMRSIFEKDPVSLQQHEPDNWENIKYVLPSHSAYDEQSEHIFPIKPSNYQLIQAIFTSLIDNFGMIWIGIALILLIRKITIYQSFVRYVKAGQILVPDIELLDRLSVIAKHLGIKKPVELCVNPLISSPLLIGFFHPCIILPSTKFSEKDFQYIILHELIHYKRKDIFYKWLVQGTVCLHWFNPFVYVMSREINNACEFSCDEALIANLDFSSRQEYGKTLLDAIVKAGTYKESLASVTLSENKKMLKERLGAIMNFKKKSRISIVIPFTLTVVLICGAFYTGAYATEDTSANRMTTNQNEQTTQNSSETFHKPGSEFRRVDMWSGSASEVTKPDGTVEVNMTNFIGDKTNYEFEAEYHDTVVLHLTSSLSGDYEILFMEKGTSTILDVIPSFTGSKEVVLTELPKGTIYLIIYSMNTSGKLEIEKVSTQHSIDEVDSSNPPTPDKTEPPYTYSQMGFYQGSYIFELGWNLDERSYHAYPDKAELILSDLSTISVSFDESCKNEAQNQAVLADLKELIEKLKTYSTLPLEYPLVVSVEYIGDNELIALAESYYIDGKLTRFSAIFSSLDNTVQKEYINKMIDDNKLTFFSSCAKYVDTSIIEYCAEKAYQEKKLTFFSSLVPYLTYDQKQAWIARASKDDRITFLSVLTK